MQALNHNPSKKLLELEGLRGVAALAVVLSHLALEFFPTLINGSGDNALQVWVYNSPFRFLYSGLFAVCIFFVMSGFVLSRKYLRTHDGAVLADGTIKRYFRLMPPVLISTILLTLSICIVRDVPPQRWAELFFSSTKEALYGSFLFGHNANNSVLWTMQIEFLGSLGLFAFLAVFGRSRWAPLAVVACAAALMKLSPLFGYFFALFLLGIYIDKAHRLLRGPIGFCAFLFGLYLGGYDAPSAAYRHVVVFANTLQFEYGIHLNWPLLFPAIGSLLVVASALACAPVSRFLSCRTAVWLGAISFSLYLTHTMTLVFITHPVGQLLTPLLGAGPSSVIVSLLAISASLLVASYFTRLVDVPSVVLANRVGKRAMERVYRRRLAQADGVSN